MTHIFVSYSRRNKKTVDHLVTRLQGDGFKVWIDRQDLAGGQHWREEIVVAIDTAYAFLLAVSPASVASGNVLKEVDLAADSNRSIIPVLLARVKIPTQFRYHLAGVQWVDYYRKPELKYAELVRVLQTYQQNVGQLPPATTKEIEIVIAGTGIDISKFGPQEREELRNFLAKKFNIPLDDLQITDIRGGSVHVFVRMPAEAAYRLKTAALNRNTDLLKYGIRALRFTNDRRFVLLRSGRIGPLNPRKSGGRRSSIGCAALLIALFLSLLTIIVVSPQGRAIIDSIFSSPSPIDTLTNIPSDTPIDTPIPSLTSTATERLTLIPSLTSISTNTFTPSPTRTFTPTLTPSITPSRTFTPTLTRTRTPTNTPNLPPEFQLVVPNNTTFYCPDPPPPPPPNLEEVLILARIQDPSGVSSVILDYWLENKATGEIPDLDDNNETMQFSNSYNAWYAVISIEKSEAPNIEYWFQFRFQVTDGSGVTTLSQEYRDDVTYWSCYFG